MSRSRFRAYPVKTPQTETGAALLAFLLILLVGGSYALLRDAKSLAQRAKLEESRKTTAALAEAKAALIGYAASAKIVPTGTGSCASNCPRPGDLPCPDQDNDGDAETNCADPSPPITTGAECAKTTGPPGPACRRLGRLPWKTLGLPDLRDGSGERLWYAVSKNFKNNTRTNCGSSGLPGCLNSDSRGTITIWDPSHTVRHHAGDNPDPYVPSGAVAVIIAPGPALRRQGGPDQDRGCTVGDNCDSNDVCTQPTLTTTPKCRAINFLDGTTDEDNQQFIDGNNSDGFMQGDVFDAAGNVVVNDRALPVTYNDIMPVIERRVVAEVLICLNEYAAANNGRYPWAAKLDASAPPEFNDDDGERFGRLPDGQYSVVFPGSVTLDNTKTAIGGTAWDYWPNKNILPSSACKLTSNVSLNTWWLNWKELIFYSVAGGFKPALGTPACGLLPDNCLTVAPPSLAQDEKVVVIAAGKSLRAVMSGQPRTTNNAKAYMGNYLEDENADYVDDGIVSPNEEVFTSKAASQTFNDVVCKQGIC